MARPTKEASEKKPLIHIRVPQEVKDTLRLLHTASLNSDTAVIIDLILSEAKRRKISVAA